HEIGALGAGGQERVDELLAIDRHRERAPDALVVERVEAAGEPEVDGVHPGSRLELEVDVRLDGLDAGPIELVDPVDGGALQLDDPLGRAVAPADDHALVAGRRAPVRLAPGEADLRAVVPALEPVGPRAVDL